MNNLLKLLQKYKTFLVFIFVQAICFILIFNQNDFHKSSILNSSNAFTGGIYETYNNSQAYFNLRDENEKLNEENARLKTQLKGYQISEYNSFSVINDSVRKLKFQFTPAQVVNTFIKGQNNYLTLNIGRKNGVEPQMGVVDANGVIGFVKDVSNHYSTVIPIIHREFLISIVHKNSSALGLLKWTDGNNRSTATAINLPKYIDLKKGDEIVCKGNDGVFLPNALVGTVESIFSEDGSDYNSAIVNLSVDYSALENVHVVKNLFREEQQKLERNVDAQ